MLRFLGTTETVQADDGCCLDVRGQGLQDGALAGFTVPQHGRRRLLRDG